MAHERSGTLQDMQHVVLWMQENRAFDHYYGVMKGVRGFNDRAAPLLQNGHPALVQNALVPGTSCEIWCIASSAVFLTIPVFGLLWCRWLYSRRVVEPPVVVLEVSQVDVSLGRGWCHRGVAACMRPKVVAVLGAALLVACFALMVWSCVGWATGCPKTFLLLPFKISFADTSGCIPAPKMDFVTDTGIFNKGRHDGWNTARAPGFGMGYLDRTDLPWYYALVDGFTIFDQYFQSVLAETCPNRLFYFTGSNGLSVGSPLIGLDNNEPGYAWETFGETLEAANVSWQVLQQLDNFDDNAFAWFDSFRNAPVGSSLYLKGSTYVSDLAAAFEAMVANDSLPSVLWLVGPMATSEHAANHPSNGEWLTAQLVGVLAKPQYASVYAKTAFLINYDEGGQFFDHHWSPTPPASADDGLSTVDIKGELTEVDYLTVPAGSPIGMGFRVPLIIVSPWTRGPLVYSEVTDHTGVLRLLEKRFNVTCPNISPWRRVVSGDLLGAFNFSSPDYTWPLLPVPRGLLNVTAWQCANLPSATVPRKQQAPTHELGTRVSRPLPYHFVISDVVTATGLEIQMSNAGSGGAAFQVHDYMNVDGYPRKYTVEPGMSLSGLWGTSAAYDLSLHGANGFVRRFAGTPDVQGVIATLTHVEGATNLTLLVAIPEGACSFRAVDVSYGGGQRTLQATAPVPSTATFDIGRSGNWYEITVELQQKQDLRCPLQGTFVRSFAGRWETGETTISDPAMGNRTAFSLLGFADLPDALAAPSSWESTATCGSPGANSQRHQHDDCFAQPGAIGGERTEHEGHDHNIL